MEEKRDEIIVEKMLTDNRVIDSVNDILDELDRAEKKHPVWPADPIHQVAILMEEAGEAVQAANDAVHHGADVGPALRRELLQVGAMATRVLTSLNSRLSRSRRSRLRLVQSYIRLDLRMN